MKPMTQELLNKKKEERAKRKEKIMRDKIIKEKRKHLEVLLSTEYDEGDTL